MKLAPRNVVLCIVLVVLIALDFTFGVTNSKATGSLSRPDALDEFDATEVATIQVVRGASRVHLDRRGQRWAVRERQGFHANELLIDSLLRPLAGLLRSDVVASNLESHALYGLEKNATDVTLYARDEADLLTFRLGRPEEEVSGSYLVFESTPDVYRASTLALPHPEPARWLDPFLVDLDLAAVQGVQAEWRDGTSFHLRLSENGRWDAVGQARSLVPARIHSLLTLCANLILDEVSDLDPGAAGLDPPLLSLRFDLEAGVRRIALGDTSEDEEGTREFRPATSADWPSPWVVQLQERSARRLESLVRQIQAEIDKTP